MFAYGSALRVGRGDSQDRDENSAVSQMYDNVGNARGIASLRLCVFAAIALALLAAYRSFRLGLPLMILQKLYNWLWQRLNR